MMQRRTILSAALAGLLGATALGLAGPAQAQVDFSGETIEWVVPFREGGGTDRWARFYAPLLSEALPGSPTVIIRNTPGGGSTSGANEFHQRARPDGLTILGTSGSTQFPYLLGDPRVRYDYEVWHTVLGTPTGGVVYVSPGLGIESAAELAELADVELLYGSQGATSLDLVPLLAFELLGLNVEPIFGMQGRSAGRLAFERGETSIDYQTTAAYLSNVVPLVEAGQAVPLMSWGALDEDGAIVRDPTFPDLPHFAEVYEMIHGAPPSGPAWDAWQAFFIAGFPAQKMVFLPDGTPQDIVDAYAAAFEAVVDDPDFRDRAQAELGVYPQVTGAAAERVKELAIGVSPEARDWVQTWLSERFGVELN